MSVFTYPVDWQAATQAEKNKIRRALDYVVQSKVSPYGWGAVAAFWQESDAQRYINACVAEFPQSSAVYRVLKLHKE